MDYIVSLVIWITLNNNRFFNSATLGFERVGVVQFFFLCPSRQTFFFIPIMCYLSRLMSPVLLLNLKSLGNFIFAPVHVLEKWKKWGKK